MAIAFPTQVTVPVELFASGTNGLLVFSPGVFSSQDLEAFDIRLAKLNSVCEEIELLKLTFELLKRSTDLSAKTGQVEALERKNVALKTKLKGAEAERDSLRPALAFLAKDWKPLICNHDSTEKRN